jgi:hypothetical protein
MLQAAAYYDPSLRNQELVPGGAFVANPLNLVTGKINTQMNAGRPVGTVGGDE